MTALNALTIDVEDYFQVSAFENRVKVSEWDCYPLRVERSCRLILELLEARGVQATFFVLGWVAGRCPELVKEIHRAGHEIACHGYGHRRVCTQSRETFRQDIRQSKELLEDLVGEAVLGYRAPSYSISLDQLWAFDELAEAGFVYDSSVFPIRHDLYGIPDWPRFPFTVSRKADGLWEPENTGADAGARSMREFPITTLALLGLRLPIAGGGYFRFFPYHFTRWGLNRINRTEGPFIFYLHPWELDPGQQRIAGIGVKSHFRHYLNLERTERRFNALLSDFQFTTLRSFMV